MALKEIDKFEAVKILNITGEINRELVKSAYRKACFKYHPDRNSSGLEKMKLINVAYAVLRKEENFVFDNKDIEPIPNNTRILAMISEAKWSIYKDEEFISIVWSVLSPNEYKGRRIYQKIRVLDENKRKSDMAKRMLAAIDTNAGGDLAKLRNAPTDQGLYNALNGSVMCLKLSIWNMKMKDGTERTGNFVIAVLPKAKF